jgi:RNA polymerase sigma factor (sigma-70 family)
MDGRRSAGAVEELRTLFRVGVIGDLDDGVLLERFLSGQDGVAEPAFAALVDRHGPMVLRVCRQLLGSAHEAEDAFQATFLVLARRASSIRQGRSLASWLFGVARRVSAHARAASARRRVHERRSAERRNLETRDEIPETWPELYEEIDRLSEKYRLPIVLHHLEGLTYEQTARYLNCPIRTVQIRLSRGRARLRGRLAQRGIASSVGVVGALLSDRAALVALPGGLAARVARSAVAFHTGKVAAAVASARALTWTSGALKSMLMYKIQSTVVFSAVAVALALGVGTIAQQGRGGQPAAALPPAPAKEKTAKAPRAAVDTRDRQILDKLEAPIDASFDKKPLEDFLKYIKAVSSGPTDNGIPIYVDPVGLREAGCTMISPIVVEMKQQPIRVGLRSALRQVGLAYRVDDGLLVIDAPPAILERRLEDVEAKLDRVLQALDLRQPR